MPSDPAPAAATSQPGRQATSESPPPRTAARLRLGLIAESGSERLGAAMRPSGTVGAALLLLLAAHFPESPALEEKRGKGVSAAPRRRAPQPALLSCFLEERLRFWPGPWEERDVSFLSWASLRRPEEGRLRARAAGGVWGAPGALATFPRHFPASLSGLGFLERKLVRSRGRSGPRGAGRRPGTCARAVHSRGQARGARPPGASGRPRRGNPSGTSRVSH